MSTGGGMWDQSSASYWKDQEKKKAKQKKMIGVGAGVLIAVMFILMSRGSGAEKESGSGIVERPAIDETIIRDCLTAHTNYHRTYTGDCGRVCKDTLSIPPVPGVYRTCLEGCTNGINMAYGITCKQGSADDCHHAQTLGCVEICKDREETQPAPKMHRHCLMACKDGFTEACNKGGEPLEETVEEHWTVMKLKAKAREDL
ncbi:hypothetical protein TrST_g7488 [Triparma strigata]|uniref:Uncharacterized protein n=1 Tax=Triparma strigata TaxID=1606541 RepID=A0A9W7A6R3_9STRA|nr:hypothetical protein TrST_g7488 [Triparma strigata]